MSDDIITTFPSITVSKNEENIDKSRSDPLLALNDWDMRWFCCMGQFDDCDRSFHNESYLTKNDLSIFEEDNINCILFSSYNASNLFKFNFDKGTTLVDEICDLFKMAKHSYMHLECIARTSLNNLVVNNTTNRKINNCMLHRETIVRFLIYLRNCLRCVGSHSQFQWLEENLFKKIKEELNSFILFCGSIINLPDYIINYPANVLGNRCVQPSYHIFHCHLDLRWLHLTLLYQLILYDQRYRRNIDSLENDAILPFEDFQLTVSNVIYELLIIALKRFHYISVADLINKSMFTCTCIRELWKLLQISCDKLHSQQRIEPFWYYVNKVCERIVKSDIKSAVDGFDLDITQKYTCTNPTGFVLWILKDLTNLYDTEPHTIARSNYSLLENCLKLFLNSETTELHIRVHLLLIESILKSRWDERTEPLVLIWEYFHKRMNSSFYISSTPINGIAIIGRSASHILKNLISKLDPQNNDKNMDSFHIFLRLLGMKLTKWQKNSDGLRCWNQLKGRLLSKFSAPKLSALNEIGLYHFILIFLTLAITADLQEMGDKLRMFLQLLPLQELEEARMKLILQAHMALILLFVERNQDVSTMSSAVLDILGLFQNHPGCLSLTRIYVEGFQDLIDYTDNLQLGQYSLIGNWIPKFLSYCTESDTKRFLDCILLLLTKLNSILSVQSPIKQNSQLLLLDSALWEYFVPYLKTISSSSSNSYQIADIAAVMTTLSFNSSFLPNNRTKAVDLFTFFINHESVDPNLLCRYVGQICQLQSGHDIYANYNIILIRAWLRCLILLSNDNENDENLSKFTNYISTTSEMEHILNVSSTVLSCQKDCFENFLLALRLKYISFDNSHSKNKFVNQISSYFSNMDKWLLCHLKSPKSAKLILNIYQSIGLMFAKIPQLLYTKSKSNSLLQGFLDLLLLSIQFRNPQIQLHKYVSEAIKKTIHLYVYGLFTLDPENDTYITRCIRELIITYIPRLVSPKGIILSHGNADISLLKCFEATEYFELMSRTILQTICSTFLKKRSRVPHQFAHQALVFLHNLIKQYKNHDRVIENIIKNVFERICDVIMFCETTNSCKTEARNMLHFILNLDALRNNVSLGNEVTNAFARLCHEHLAFSSRNLFDLFEDIVSVAPDLVFRFLPKFNNEVKEVENKRGVGYDRALRKGLERIEDALKHIRCNSESHISLT